MRTYVFELEEAEVAEIRDSEVSRLDGDDDLDELHRLRPEQIHRRTALSHSLSLLSLSISESVVVCLCNCCVKQCQKPHAHKREMRDQIMN